LNNIVINPNQKRIVFSEKKKKEKKKGRKIPDELVASDREYSGRLCSYVAQIITKETKKDGEEKSTN
jgi:hypothetical protein